MGTRKKLNRDESGKILREVFTYLGNYKALMFLTVALATAIVVLTLYVPILTGNAIDFLIGKGEVDFKSVLAILIKVCVIVAITGLLQWIMNTVNNRIT